MNKTPRSFEHEQKVADFLDAFSPLTENIVRSFIADYPEFVRRMGGWLSRDRGQ
jgi:hypothetical protein